MGRRTEAPVGFECPYRHQCPHLDGLSAQWALEVYHECDELRMQMTAMEAEYERRIEELEKVIAERDQKIAQLQVQHRKQFKPDRKKDGKEPIQVKVKRRGAPRGHPPWRRREPDHVDRVVEVPAPTTCPHCQCQNLPPHPGFYEHLQEDIVLTPRTFVTRFVHHQSLCPNCRRAVYQAAQGELPGCCIGPVTRAVAMHLRYDLQIPYRRVRHILSDLFGMPLVPATAMNFDRKATTLALPLYEDLLAKLKSSPVAYADETTWREDGQGHFVWFGGNNDLAVYRITDNRAQESAVELLGEDFDGTLVTDDYAGYNAVKAKDRQTCWNHIRTRAKEIVQQIELIDPPVKAPRSIEFCRELGRFAVGMCALGRKMRGGKLSLRKARTMVPSLRRQLKKFADHKLDYPAAQTLRRRVMEKDWKKLFTFLRVKGVEPTNNHSERSLRFLVIMRKVCFGTRSPSGSQSHGVLPSLLQTARRQKKDAIKFLTALLTLPPEHAKDALFAGP